MSEKGGKPPRPQDYRFDLEQTYRSLVAVRAQIPEDAFTASVLGTERGGNGVVINDDGLILTIGYLVTEAETIWLTDRDGKATPGHVLGYDQESGFGLIQALRPLGLPALEIGSSADLSEGDRVILAGFGGPRGSISARVTGIREFAGYWEYLLDAAIFTAPAHQNWGGTALIGEDGKLRGIGSLFIQQGSSEDDVVDGNMVVPIDLLEPILEDMSTLGRPNKEPRPWLGLFGTEVENRVVVAALSRGGPADRADIQVGDIVLAVNGQRVSTLAGFFRRVWSLGPAGVEVPLSVARDGDVLSVAVQSIARADVLKRPKLH